MLKFLIAIAIIAGLVGFTGPGQELTANILTVVNPVSQERKTVTDLQKNIDGISTVINDPEFQKLSDPGKISQLNGLIKKVKNNTTTLQGALQHGDLAATASMLIQKIAGTQTSSQPTTSLAPGQSNCPIP